MLGENILPNKNETKLYLKNYKIEFGNLRYKYTIKDLKSESK